MKNGNELLIIESSKLDQHQYGLRHGLTLIDSLIRLKHFIERVDDNLISRQRELVLLFPINENNYQQL